VSEVGEVRWGEEEAEAECECEVSEPKGAQRERETRERPARTGCRGSRRFKEAQGQTSTAPRQS
jgi:hypothetical protein